MTTKTAVDFLLSLIAVLLVTGGLLSERAAAGEVLPYVAASGAHVETASHPPVSKTTVRPVSNTSVPHGSYAFAVRATSPTGQRGETAIGEFEDLSPRQP